MRFYNVAVLMLAAAPIYAQRAEVYVLGGYSHTSELDQGGLFFPAATAQTFSANGGFLGAGASLRVAGIFGVQGEFSQIRNPHSSPWPVFNAGTLNFVLEKRTGRFRPGGILLGLSGGKWGGDTSFYGAQIGAGVAVQMTHRLFLRPQVRFQSREHKLFGRDPHSMLAGVALGYRF